MVKILKVQTTKEGEYISCEICRNALLIKRFKTKYGYACIDCISKLSKVR